MIRLNKYLSESGICSRREADRLIEAGKVTVDGIKARPGMKVDDTAEIKVGKRIIAGRAKKVVLAVYKPAGIVCTEDGRVRNNIIRCLDYPVRVTYAGRLDKDSEGLLIMTNDGELINRMMRARYRHEKEYEVTVDKLVTEAFLKTMACGVHIRDEEKGIDTVTRPCKVRRTGPCTFTIVLTQGINRQIRRMCEASDYHVRRLLRTRVMNVMLGGLEPGAYRKLTKQELKELYEQCEESKDAGISGAFE